MSRLPTSYRHTTVSWGKSQADIMRLLGKHGVLDTRFTTLTSRNEIICEFNYPTTIEEKEVVLGVRIIIPLPPPGRMHDIERLKNQAHRALFYYLKSKFEALQFGLVEFVQEFLAHLTLLDKLGHSLTIYQSIGSQLKKGYLTGKQGEVNLLEGPKSNVIS